MELVHHHIARVPVAPSEVSPEIPEVVSAIIMKLLEKNAEQRYQTAGVWPPICSTAARCYAMTGKLRPFHSVRKISATDCGFRTGSTVAKRRSSRSLRRTNGPLPVDVSSCSFGGRAGRGQVRSRA